MTNGAARSRPHPLSIMPGPLARGDLARSAFTAWQAEQMQRRASASPPPPAADEPPPSIRAGLGVWCRIRINGEVGPLWMRCHVMARDELSGRWLVANIDAPGTQFYASTTDIVPRYAGEIAPGQAPAAGAPDFRPRPFAGLRMAGHVERPDAETPAARVLPFHTTADRGRRA